MYVNGTDKTVASYSLTPTTAEYELIVGGGPSSFPYSGRIDDVRLYPAALSQDDIAELLAEGN